MPQSEHATEAQLKSRIRGDRWIADDHAGCGDREDRISMPVAPQERAERTDDCHQGRPDRARRGRHHENGDESRHSDACRSCPIASQHHPCNEGHDPSENGEIETRDRQDVRKTGCPETRLDRRISRLRIPEYERDEHRPDAIGLLRDAGEQAVPECVAEPVATSVHTIEHGTRRHMVLNDTAEFERLDIDRRDDATSPGDLPWIAVAWIANRAQDRECADRADPVCCPPWWRCTGDEHRDLRASETGSGVLVEHGSCAVRVNEDDIPQHRAPARRFLEVSCENVGGEPARNEGMLDRAFDAHDGTGASVRIGARDGDFGTIPLKRRLLQP
jgi:hypothetical protein